MRLETHGLLEMKSLEVTPLGVALEPTDSFCNGIHRSLILALGLFQEDEIFAFHTLIIGMVFLHGLTPLAEVTVYEENPAIV